MERKCGECTACCKTHGILKIMKMSGDWCPHCEIGRGCKIYAERPEECRTFKCTWLLGIDGSGPQHRPDIIGLVPECREISKIGMAMWFWEFRDGVLCSNFVKHWSMLNLLAGNCVMHVSLGADHKLYLSENVDVSGLTFYFGQDREKVSVVSFPESISQLV